MLIFNIYNLFNWPGLFQQTAEQYVLGILETTRQDLLLLRKRHRKLLCELTNGMYYSKKICEGGYLKHVHLIARSIKMLYGAAQYVRPYGQTSHKHTQEFHRWFLMIFLFADKRNARNMPLISQFGQVWFIWAIFASLRCFIGFSTHLIWCLKQEHGIESIEVWKPTAFSTLMSFRRAEASCSQNVINVCIRWTCNCLDTKFA